MIFAAGLGTRLRPLTDSRPKALVEVGGKPLVRHLIDKLQRFGYNDIVLNVHHFADMIEEYFRSSDLYLNPAPEGGLISDLNSGSDLKIAFSDERDLLRDTGGGLLHARPLLEGSEPFLVHNVDALTNLDFSILNDEPQTKLATREPAVATLVVSDRLTSRYLLFNEDMRLVGWENRRTGEIRSPYLKNAVITSTLGIDSPSVRACPELHTVRPYAFSGIHKISSAIFPALERYASIYGKVFSIIDFYISICSDLPIRALIPESFQMLDAGKPDTLSLADDFLLTTATL